MYSFKLAAVDDNPATDLHNPRTTRSLVSSGHQPSAPKLRLQGRRPRVQLRLIEPWPLPPRRLLPQPSPLYPVVARRRCAPRTGQPETAPAGDLPPVPSGRCRRASGPNNVPRIMHTQMTALRSQERDTRCTRAGPPPRKHLLSAEVSNELSEGRALRTRFRVQTRDASEGLCGRRPSCRRFGLCGAISLREAPLRWGGMNIGKVSAPLELRSLALSRTV